MRPIPASPDASRGICDENRPAPQQQALFDPQVPDYPIPLNDCSLALLPLSEYGGAANGRSRRTGRSARGGNGGSALKSPDEAAAPRLAAPREALPQPLDVQCHQPAISQRENRHYSSQAERLSVQISSRQSSSFAEPRSLYETDLAGPGLYHLQDCGP